MLATRSIPALALLLCPVAAAAQSPHTASPSPARLWVAAAPGYHVGHGSNYQHRGLNVALGLGIPHFEIRGTVATNGASSGCLDCASPVHALGDVSLLVHSAGTWRAATFYLGAGPGWITAGGTTRA